MTTTALNPAQQLVASITTPMISLPHLSSKEAPQKAQAPRTMHFTRPAASSEGGLDAGFSFGRAQIPINFGRRPAPKPVINTVNSDREMSNQDDGPHCSEVPSSECASSEQISQSKKATTLIADTIPTTETARADETAADLQGMTNSTVASIKAAKPLTPVASGGKASLSEQRLESIEVERTICASDVSQATANTFRHVKPPQTTHSGHNSPSSHFTPRRRDSPSSTQLSSENLLKIVLHRQHLKENVEKELLLEIQQKDAEIARLMQDMNTLHENLASVQGCAEELRSDLAQKSAMVANTTEKMRRLQDFVKGLSRDHEALKGDMESYTTIARDLVTEKTTISEAIGEIRGSIDDAGAKLRGLSANANHQVELVSQKLSCKDEQCHEMTKLLEAERSHGRELLEQLQASAGRVRAESDAFYQPKLDIFHDQLGQLKEDVYRKEQALRSEEIAKGEFQVSLGQAMSEKEILEEEKDTLRRASEEHLEKLSEVVQKHLKLENEMNRKDKDIENLRTQQESMARKCEALDVQFREVQKQAHVFEESTRLKHNDIEQLTQRLEHKEQELREVGTLRERLQNVQTSIIKYEDALKEKEIALQGRQKMIEMQAQQLQCIPRLQDQLRAAENDKISCSNALNLKSTELDNLQEILESKRLEIEILRPYESEATQLRNAVLVKEQEMATHKHEMALAKAAAQATEQQAIQLTAAKARVELLEDEQAKQSAELFTALEERNSARGDLTLREGDVRALTTMLAREKEVMLIETRHLKSQIEDKEQRLVASVNDLANAKERIASLTDEAQTLTVAQEPGGSRKSVSIFDPMSAVTPHRLRRKANRNLPAAIKEINPEESQDHSQGSLMINAGCIADSQSIKATSLGNPDDESEEELQYIHSPPSERQENSISSTRVSQGPGAPSSDLEAAKAVAPTTKASAQDSQAIDTQQGAFLLDVPRVESQLLKETAAIGHATKLDPATERRAKKHPIENIPRPTSQTSNTSNKRKHPSAAYIIPDSQSQSLPQPGPRSILKTSTTQRIWATEVTELSSTSITNYKKPRSSAVQDLGPIISSSPMDNIVPKKRRSSAVQDLGPILSSSPMGTIVPGRRKLSHRSTKRSDKFARKFGQEGSQAD